MADRERLCGEHEAGSGYGGDSGDAGNGDVWCAWELGGEEPRVRGMAKAMPSSIQVESEPKGSYLLRRGYAVSPDQGTGGVPNYLREANKIP